MEKNKEELTELMKNLEKAMEMTRGKKESIDKKQQDLREETRIMMVEEEKKEIQNLEKAKSEFDEMTVNSLIKANQQIKEIREKSEKEYQNKLIETIQKRKEIEEKLKNMKGRDLTPKKLQWAEQSATKALENVNNEMKNYQEKYLEEYNKLDTWGKQITDWSIELGCEDKLVEETKQQEEVKQQKETSNTSDKEIQEKIDKAKQEMENSNRDYSNVNLEAGAQVGAIHMPQNSNLNAFEKNNIITKTKEMMEKENKNYGNIHLKVDSDYTGKNQIAKIESISISEGEGIIYAKTENGETTKISLKEALEGKKDNFKNLNVKELCKEISGNKIKGLLLGTKVNPAIIHALKDDPETVRAYITCLKEGKELPFELSHDLRNSQLGMFDKMKMWVHARAENKIPGTKVTFTGKFWNKNKALGTAEKEEANKGETKETDKNNVKEEYKVENKDNRIEQEAAKVMKETEKSMAEEVKNMGQEK